MSFNNIAPIEKPDIYLEAAFRNAKDYALMKKHGVRGDPFKKTKNFELALISSVTKNLRDRLDSIIVSFPNFDDLTEFYEELIRLLLDFHKIKECLGSLNWAKTQIGALSNDYKNRINGCKTVEEFGPIGKAFLGRISSVFKQIKKNLLYLEKTRKVVKSFPSIKEGYMTVAIAGFPNVGKSTLLSKITSSKPDIQSYAFTTKRLNVGYMKEGVKKIQFIDTPGTLNRLDKMNDIEKIAYLAIKYCADVVLYIYDLTEEYSIEDQEKLFERIKEFDKPTIVYMSKTDILDKKVVSKFAKKVGAIIDTEELRAKILEHLKSKVYN